MALRYADTVNTGVAAASPHLIFDWGSSTAEASGTFSQFLSGGWSTQGALSGSIFSGVHRGIVGELGGFAGGSTHNDGTRTGEVLGNLRVHYPRESNEIFAGIGAGRTSFGNGSQKLLLGEVGVALQVKTIDATLTVSPVALDSINYADSQLSLSWTRRSVDFEGILGFRVGDQLTDLGATARAWGSLSAVAWLRPHLAAVLSRGTYPIDPTQGFPGGRFLSASIRLTRGYDRALPAAKPRELPPAATAKDAPVVERFTWQKSDARQVTLRANAPRAQTVEITGDFTNWVPIRLSAESKGWWAITLPLSPGKYQMNLRVNGGNWAVPPGLLSMADEFGGAVGLLIVE